MQTTTPTAREQFVEDYLLVVENDADAWTTLQDYADEAEQTATKINLTPVYLLAERLKNEWEDSVMEATYELQDGIMQLLIRQMLIGYGIDPFHDIAKRVFLARD
jgi:hypothetical protein